MLFFECDYSEGCAPKIMDALLKSNNAQCSGYGFDEYSLRAKNKIKNAVGDTNAEVYLLVGGTQTNRTIIDSILTKYEGVLAAVTGHVSVHEAGAIEASGHKVLTLPEHDGKIYANELNDYMETFLGDATHDHMVQPGMVYISHPTEYGTLYSKEELTNIKNICDKYHLPLYLDGARLGYGLMSDESDMNIQDIYNLCDVFYIGGTKVGALCGEAVVFHKETLPKHFITTIKQNGALLAKGRLLGVQFDTLFTDNYYFEISKNAIQMANLLKEKLKEKNIPFFLDSPTNQQFLIFEDSKLEEIKDKVAYSFWTKLDETHTVIRFATSWATKEEDVLKLIELL